MRPGRRWSPRATRRGRSSRRGRRGRRGGSGRSGTCRSTRGWTWTTSTGRRGRLSSPCTGPVDDDVDVPEDYRTVFERAVARKLTLVCANPDRVVQKGERLIYCAGALADLYAEMGGEVVMAGKPYAPIYRLALAEAERLAGRSLDRARGLCIGDGLRTDVAGANGQGLDVLFVGAGIHGEEDAAGGRDVGRRCDRRPAGARRGASALWDGAAALTRDLPRAAGECGGAGRGRAERGRSRLAAANLLPSERAFRAIARPLRPCGPPPHFMGRIRTPPAMTNRSRAGR